MNNNLRDIHLLKNNPNQLVVECQDLILIVVKKFLADERNKDQLNEHIQNVNYKLLEKLPKIQKQFKGKSLLKTYLSSIVSNICIDIIKSEKRANFVSLEEIKDLQSNSYHLHEVYFKEEIKRLKHILIAYGKQRFKIEFLMKIKFRIPIDKDDIVKSYGHADEGSIEKLLNFTNYESLTEDKIFKYITPFINKFEKKENTEFAINKWIKRKIDELIHLMNGNPPRASYDINTLKILVENYYVVKYA